LSFCSRVHIAGKRLNCFLGVGCGFASSPTPPDLCPRAAQQPDTHPKAPPEAMAATARPDQAAPTPAAPDTDIQDVVRMAKGAIQEQQERQKREPAQHKPSPFQSPDAAAHLGPNASAAYPSPTRPQGAMQPQQQQQQRRKQKGTPWWRALCCCGRPAVHGERAAVYPRQHEACATCCRMQAACSHC
jgi:hypothetical protein